MKNFFRFAWELSSHQFKVKLSFFTLLSIIVSLLDIGTLYFFANIISSIVKATPVTFPDFRVFGGFEISNLSLNSQYKIALIVVIALVLVKTFAMFLLNRIILTRLALEYCKNSDLLLTKLTQLPHSTIKKYQNYEIFLAINNGVRDMFINFSNACINCLVEIFIITILCLAIFNHGGVATFMLLALFVPTFIAVSKYTGKVVSQNSRNLITSNLASAITVQSLIESFREVKVFNSFSKFISDHRTTTSDSATAVVNIQNSSYLPKLLLEAIFVIGVALFTWIELSIGSLNAAIAQVTFFVAMGSRAIPSILRFHLGANQIRQVMGSAQYTQKIFSEDFEGNREIKVSKPDILESPGEFSPDIEIKDLGFKFRNSTEWVVKNLSLKIKAGESVGIVGRTGCGKTTLVELILGIHSPDRGSITISGKDLKDLPGIFDGRIAYVPQAISLIDGSIKDNIVLGRVEKLFQLDDFTNAIEFANLASFIEKLPLGINTQITRSGSELSGGQRQKLGIARAIIDNPKILVLDEASSSLDLVSEYEINRAIEACKGKITLIVVAHKLSTVKLLDRIIFLENGEIKDQGTYSSLQESSAKFREFVKLEKL